jgi:hypothetical protein
MAEDQYVLTTGSRDRSILQWRLDSVPGAT